VQGDCKEVLQQNQVVKTVLMTKQLIYQQKVISYTFEVIVKRET
jgi:hypothetical protein